MTQVLPISVFIIAKNEADRIGAAMDSVRGWVDEIIVIDSGSQDETKVVAESKGARVLHHEWQGYGPQKRFGEEQCKHHWLLNLDADEVISPALAEEIRQIFLEGATPKADGYELKIADCLPGQEFPGQFAHTTLAVRLYDKRKGRYADSTVHDRVHFLDGCKIKRLNARVYHHSIRSLGHAIDKLNSYTSMQADHMLARGKVRTWLALRLVMEPVFGFFKSYVLRLDCTRGMPGFINSVTYAYSRFVRLAKVYEARYHNTSTLK